MTLLGETEEREAQREEEVHGDERREPAATLDHGLGHKQTENIPDTHGAEVNANYQKMSPE